MRRFIICFVGYALVAVAATFPLVLHLSTTVPHDAGDPMLSATLLWWNAHTAPFTARWWDGFAFYPARGMLALSDPRLGETLIAAPLLWLGASPIVAYNLTLLTTFVLSALAAHWLAFVLTRRHDAATVAGLAYGFAPFRIAHIEHLELLAGFAMPIALGALHRYNERRDGRWLALFAAAIVVQALLTSYYALFFTVLAALWLMWFVGIREWRVLAAVGGSAILAVASLAPLIAGYVRVHARYSLARPFTEIVSLSADVTSLALASPLVAAWGWTSRWIGFHIENELFAGIALPSLVVCGVVLALRTGPPEGEKPRHPAVWLLGVAGAFAAIAVCGWLLPPWRVRIGPLEVASDTPYKPFSLALIAFFVWAALFPAVRRASARRSVFAFYVLATVAMFVLAAGPKPAFAGHQIFYKPPYAWLMELPAFGSIRAPARFTMLAVLTLSIAAALAFNRFRWGGMRRCAAAVAIGAAILSDGWVLGLPLAPAPDVWPPDRAAGYAAVLELPLGDPFADLAAMFRATAHRRPVVNGNSGFEPTHYLALRTALEEHDPSAFDGLAFDGRTLVSIDNRLDPDAAFFRMLNAHPRASLLDRGNRWTFFALDPPPSEPHPCADAYARPAAGTPHGIWTTGRPQHAGDALMVDLESAAQPCAVVLSVGEFTRSYPRLLFVDASLDGTTWTTVATQRTAGLTILGALEDPRRVPITIPLECRAARFVRLRLGESHPEMPWVLTGVEILTTSGGGGL